MRYLDHFNPTRTPQTEQASPLQVPNSAGGYSFAVDEWTRLTRFLIMGCEGGTYYGTERNLTRENAACVLKAAELDPARAAYTIANVSDAGRAAKNDPAVFALALMASSDNQRARSAALDVLPRVCRIGTDLFHFAATCNELRGWGRGLRHAVARWYTSKTPDQLAYQVAKYGQRDGWSHADLVALSHVSDVNLNPMLRYIATGIDGGGERVIRNPRTGAAREYPDPGALPDLIHAFEEAKHADERRTIQLIRDHHLTHEMIRTEHKNSAAVWEALLERMPVGAMVRNLGKMTAVGTVAGSANLIADRLQNADLLRKARLHPVKVIAALLTYQQGHGDRGKLTWRPSRKIIDALDAGFYASFGALEPSGVSHMLALDVSGSMDDHYVSGVPGLTARVGAACMAMVTARAERDWQCLAFTSNGWRTDGKSKWGASYPATVSPLDISPRQRIDDIVKRVQALPMGGTDCALPMIYAEQHKIPVELFTVYTDNETWAGTVHPFQALRSYRQRMGIPARLAVVSMAANGFSIADPSDAGMLDLVGFDTDTPQLLTAFARGEV